MSPDETSQGHPCASVLKQHYYCGGLHTYSKIASTHLRQLLSEKTENFIVYDIARRALLLWGGGGNQVQ